MAGRGPIRRIAAVLRTVPDLAAAADFYGTALGFQIARSARELGREETDLLGVPGARVSTLEMRLGRQSIEFLRFDPAGLPYPADGTASDLWFQHCAVVVADMERAFQAVASHPMRPLSLGGPQQLPPETGSVRAFKFRDPFGHPLELLWFPPGVGDPAWHAGAAELFRGIDHTAIAVAGAEASTRFYRDVLGFTVADRTLNRGIAQDRLDAIGQDMVDVVALAPAEAPPHLELLCYRAGMRRPLRDDAPADASVSRTLAEADDLERVISGLDAFSHSPAASRRGRWRGRDALTFRDPDGHTWICTAAAG